MSKCQEFLLWDTPWIGGGSMDVWLSFQRRLCHGINCDETLMRENHCTFLFFAHPAQLPAPKLHRRNCLERRERRYFKLQDDTQTQHDLLGNSWWIDCTPPRSGSIHYDDALRSLPSSWPHMLKAGPQSCLTIQREKSLIAFSVTAHDANLTLTLRATFTLHHHCALLIHFHTLKLH